jgi:hypothetical protein
MLMFQDFNKGVTTFNSLSLSSHLVSSSTSSGSLIPTFNTVSNFQKSTKVVTPRSKWLWFFVAFWCYHLQK